MRENEALPYIRTGNLRTRRPSQTRSRPGCGSVPRWRTPRPAALRGAFAGWSRVFPSVPESPWNPGTARAGAAPPGAWELRRRHRGGGEAGCEWSGHFLFLCSFPQLWVVAAAVLRLPSPLRARRRGQRSRHSAPRRPQPRTRLPRASRARRFPPQ